VARAQAELRVRERNTQDALSLDDGQVE
jgi:hypothetical protein